MQKIVKLGMVVDFLADVSSLCTETNPARLAIALAAGMLPPLLATCCLLYRELAAEPAGAAREFRVEPIRR